MAEAQSLSPFAVSALWVWELSGRGLQGSAWLGPGCFTITLDQVHLLNMVAEREAGEIERSLPPGP